MSQRPGNAKVDLPQVVSDDPWVAAKESQRKVANLRGLFIAPMIAHMDKGVRQTTAIDNVFMHLNAGDMGEEFAATARALGKAGKYPSKASAKRWIKAFALQGKVGLLPHHTGRVRKDYGWEADAIAMYNIPSKPSMADVAFNLRQMGFADATDSRVRAWLKSLPATLGKESPQRVGKHYYQLNHKRHISRDTSVLLVGEVYSGDGHTVDAYIAHPQTGKPWRPELTVWIDIRSLYIVGWYLSDAESSVSTLLSLSHAMQSHNHVPAWLHIDNGAGFKSKMMNDESTGFYSRFAISTMFSIPGNSRGKGHVEHWFRTYRDRFDKFWNEGKDYCGHDMAEETNRRISIEIDQGKRSLRSLHEYRDGVAAYIEQYNNEPQRNLNGQSPAQLWSTLDPVAVEMAADAIVRPRDTRVVRKQMVTLHKRTYFNSELMHYDKQSVTVEYDLHNDKQVWIHDAQGRLICIAELTHKVAYLPQSRLDEGREKRRKGQVHRLQKKLDEVNARANTPVDAGETLDALEQLQGNTLEGEYTEVLDKHDAASMELGELLDFNND